MMSWPRETSERLQALRGLCPLIHHLTNTVVTNLTANVTLACGAAPVMAPCIREVEEMVTHAGALLLNIGTLDEALVESMLVAGRRANQLSVPVVLDPVGAGATRLRTEAAGEILNQVKVSVVRGNAGEIRTLAGGAGKVRGVDSMEGIEVDERGEAVSAFASLRRCVVAITGPTDFVFDGRRCLRVRNGHSLMGRVTGMGCSATTVVAAFVAADREHPLEATVCALAAFGLAGEIAARECPGPGSFVPRLLDALAALDERTLLQGVKIEEAG